MIYQVIVYECNGEKTIIDLGAEEQFKNTTVRQLKEKILKKCCYFKSDWPEKTRLIFTDRYLDRDSALLSEYGITNKSVIRMAMKLSGGGGPAEGKEDDGMGDKEGETRRSMENVYLKNFQQTSSNTLGSNPSFR